MRSSRAALPCSYAGLDFIDDSSRDGLFWGRSDGFLSCEKQLIVACPWETLTEATEPDSQASCDNMSVVSYINKGGRTRRTLCLQAVNLLQQYLCHHITLHAIHLPGEDNILADSLSGKAGSVCISTCTQEHVIFVLCMKYFTCACKIFCFSAHSQSNISIVHATFIF